MINTTESEQVIGIQTYYEQSAKAYNNWGRDLERDGIYALWI